jgi:hypothetical protein
MLTWQLSENVSDVVGHCQINLLEGVKRVWATLRKIHYRESWDIIGNLANNKYCISPRADNTLAHPAKDIEFCQGAVTRGHRY